MFTPEEVSYLQSQPLARMATVSGKLQPDVVPVPYQFDGRAFYVSGMNLEETRKFKNVQAGNDRVALVVDDLASVDPWRPRGIRIYGIAEIVERSGQPGALVLRVTPEVSWSWAIVGTPFQDGKFKPHKTVHQGA